MWKISCISPYFFIHKLILSITLFKTMEHFVTIGLALAGTLVGAQNIGPGPEALWPNGIIPYDINPNFSPEDRVNLQRAISDYHAKTCLRWIPRQGQSAYVHFTRVNDGCAYADNCHDGGKRTASFGSCRNWDTMIHEMGHTVCYGHEQDRNDKDEFIERSCAGNGLYDHLNFGHLYDYRSIMHYGGMGGSNCAKLPGVNDTGSPIGLSVLDAEKLNDAYQCQGCLSYRYRWLHQLTNESDLLIGGTDASGENLYPCRAYVNGDIVPGKAKLGSEPVCWMPYDGKEVRVTSGFEVLTNPHGGNFRWGSHSGNAIAGGRTTSAETLYIARCLEINGRRGQTPGKLHGNRMYASWNGSEVLCEDYEVLVC